MPATRSMILGVIALLLAPSTATAARASDWHVDWKANCAAGDGSPGHPFCTIGEAVAVADDGDTIHVAGGTYAESLSITASITISGGVDGLETILDGQATFRVMTISGGGSVTLLGLTMTRGDAKTLTYGGGVFLDSSTLAVVDCRFDANKGTFGGAIASTHATLQVERCTFIHGNTSSNGGGCLWADDSTIDLVDCVFDTQARPLHAIACTTSLAGTTFTRGGAAIFADRGTLAAADCGFSIQTDKTSLNATAIHALDCDQLTLARCTFGNCGGPDDEGALVVDEVRSTILEECVFSTCESRSNGGALNFLDRPDATSTLELTGCTFTSCVAGTGGAIRGWICRGSMTIRDTSFGRCRADAGGAIECIDFGAIPLLVDGCSFTGNRADFGSGGAILLRPAASPPVGPLDITFRDCAFLDNTATLASDFGGASGGAIYVSPGSGSHSADRTRYERCRFAGNECTVEGVSVSAFGGAIHVGDGATEFVDCVIVDNLVECSASGYSPFAAGGGGITASGSRNSPLSIIRCTIAGNEAIHDIFGEPAGGGIHILDPWDDGTTIEQSVIAKNRGVFGATDIAGTVNTLGHNLIGDLDGCTLLGDPSTDLLEVDPQFAGASVGNYRLTPYSPAVDSGAPGLPLPGDDTGGYPRSLDGDLDGLLVTDRGGLEFSHVDLQITGNLRPGFFAFVVTTGTPSDDCWLFIGCEPGESPIPHFGSLLMDLSAPYLLLDWSPVPSTTPVSIDPSLPPSTYYVQMASFLGDAGNLSNRIVVEIE